jgi:hypothetical protein
MTKNDMISDTALIKIFINIFIFVLFVSYQYVYPEEVLFNKISYNNEYVIYKGDKKVGYFRTQYGLGRGEMRNTLYIKTEMTMYMQIGKRKGEGKQTIEEWFSSIDPYKLISRKTERISSFSKPEIVNEFIQDNSFRIEQIYEGGSRSKTTLVPSETLYDAMRIELDCVNGVKEGHEGKFVSWNSISGKDEECAYKFDRIEQSKIDGIENNLAYVSFQNNQGDSLDGIFEMGTGKMIQLSFPDGFAYKLVNKDDKIESTDVGFKSVTEFVNTDKEIKKRATDVIARCILVLPDADEKNMPKSDRMKYQVMGNDLRVEIYADSLNPQHWQKKKIDKELLKELIKEEPSIQSRHPEIIECAKEIVSGAKRTHEKINKINTWVHEKIKGEDVKYIDALETLRTGKASCNGKANLAVALARACGIPAVRIGGIVYVTRPKKKFAMHAWVRYYINGEGIEMDPTLGVSPVDASYIEMPSVLESNLLGKIIKVIEIDTK